MNIENTEPMECHASFNSQKERKEKATSSMDIYDPDEHVFNQLDDGKYGSVKKIYENLHAEGKRFVNNLSALQLSFSELPLKSFQDLPQMNKRNDSTPLKILACDEENANFQDRHCHEQEPYGEADTKVDFETFIMSRKTSIKYENVILQSSVNKQSIQVHVDKNNVVQSNEQKEDAVVDGVLNAKQTSNGTSMDVIMNEELDANAELISLKDTHEHSSEVEIHDTHEHSSEVEIQHKDDAETSKGDGLEDLWRDMSLAMECSKKPMLDPPVLIQKEEECNHSCILQDDLGYVCRICGLIEKGIETIFDNQWSKATQTARTRTLGSHNSKNTDKAIQYSECLVSEHFVPDEISIHPRHMKHMRPHQLEGFNFLARNFVTDKPGGCILAHAPGSGKTFMLISFIQSFLARYPKARPLVVLPKGIISTWKKEFEHWQVEDIPLYDFYAVKADNRSQQFDVLKKWEESKSILFLSYKQFTNIISGVATSDVVAACQERLLKVPGLLIIDEGHTPRNGDTLVADSLAKVQTPRKVVLSGTLYQNHVEEVFSILKLVRPRFMLLESSRAIVKRIFSRLEIPGKRRRVLVDGGLNAFFELVEDTLQNDTNYKRKVAVIQDLRELTQFVLHYYKGDFLDELPGLLDFTVFLKLSARQKEIVHALGKNYSFKRNSVGSAVYVHPQLRELQESASGSNKGATYYDGKIESLIGVSDVRDGVKAKFFLGILSLSESAGEKLLVFSQYLLPLKFLERLVVREKGWRFGTEMFEISGDSSPEQREWSMEQFNNSPNAKVFFGSIKACGEGISLVGASRVVILDVHLNPSVTHQAIARAFRPGQEKKVYVYRLVAADSPEEDDHTTSFRKESIAKMWFEWNEYQGNQEVKLEQVDVPDCQDLFFESPTIREDIKALYQR